MATWELKTGAIEASGLLADIDGNGQVASQPKPWPGDRWDHITAVGPAARFYDGTARRLRPGDAVSWHVELAAE